VASSVYSQDEKGYTMTIFQVMNEENEVCSEYTEINRALIDAQSRAIWDDEHIYHIEEIKLIAA